MSGELDRIPQLMHELHNRRTESADFTSSYRDQYLTERERHRVSGVSLISSARSEKKFCACSARRFHISDVTGRSLGVQATRSLGKNPTLGHSFLLGGYSIFMSFFREHREVGFLGIEHY